MTGQSVLARLKDITAAIDGTGQAMSGVGLEAFAASWTLKHAVQRALEIISEASRHLPDACVIASEAKQSRTLVQSENAPGLLRFARNDASLAEIIRTEIHRLTEKP
jgi:hypothetical protein